MNIHKSVLLFACLAVTGSAHAALFDRGGGFFYDTVYGVTWTQNANINGAHSLASQTAWAEGLSLYDSARNVTWDDWRLASHNELSHMYYFNGFTAVSPGPFTGLVADWYWGGKPVADTGTGSYIFNFDESGIVDYEDNAAIGYYAWAVRSGDVGLPVPTAVDDGPIPVIDGVAKIISVGANDTGFTNPVTVTVTTPPTKGTIDAIDPPGPASNMAITYTANIGAVGADSFVYEMADSTPASDAATVTVNISPDTDADGVPDATDNCSAVANANQCDTDGDGYGNHCDGDLNNNTFTNAQDYILFRAQLGQPSVAPTYNQADLNCNGFVNAQDYVLFRSLLGQPSGPSGLACAGTVPCP